MMASVHIPEIDEAITLALFSLAIAAEDMRRRVAALVDEMNPPPQEDE